VDCLCALAHVALYNDWVRPTFHCVSSTTYSDTTRPDSKESSGSFHRDNKESPAVDTGGDTNNHVSTHPNPVGTQDSALRLQLLGLRHPLLEKSLGAGKYIPSDLTLSGEQQMCLITGPNMGGKSTFMRAVGLAVVLAQLGSFVPVTHAHLQVGGFTYRCIVAVGVVCMCSGSVYTTILCNKCGVSPLLRPLAIVFHIPPLHASN
jgi:hypothetical protein